MARRTDTPNGSFEKAGGPRMVLHKIFGPADLHCGVMTRYLGVTSRAKWLDTTSRISARFLPASIMASREP
jgi:hypothetical protein